MDKHDMTLAIIKPDATRGDVENDVLRFILLHAICITALRRGIVPVAVWERFYAEHRERPFFRDLVDFMASGPVVVMVLRGVDVIAEWRAILGATDPRKAERGTLRGMWGNQAGVVYENVAHGSDSPESFAREARIFFHARDLDPNPVLDPQHY